jgi:hypothetical protein
LKNSLAVEYEDKATIKYEIYDFRGGLTYLYDFIFYEDEQPVKLKVTLIGNPEKTVKIGRDDWYNLIELTIIKGDCYEDGEVIGMYKQEEKRKGKYKILKAEDLTDGEITPKEEKYAIISILDENNKYFKGNYCYAFRDILSHESIRRIPRSYIHFRIEKPVTDKQKRDWFWRKGERAEEAENYKSAIENYEEVLKLSHNVRTIGGRKVETSGWTKKQTFFKLADLYEKVKDYKNARVNLENALEYYKKGMLKDKEIERLQKMYEEAPTEHRKKVLKRELDGHKKQREYEEDEVEKMQKKLKELDELIKKQNK